jgi:hypothetical protein
MFKQLSWVIEPVFNLKSERVFCLADLPKIKWQDEALELFNAVSSGAGWVGDHDQALAIKQVLTEGVMSFPARSDARDAVVYFDVASKMIIRQYVGELDYGWHCTERGIPRALGGVQTNVIKMLPRRMGDLFVVFNDIVEELSNACTDARVTCTFSPLDTLHKNDLFLKAKFPYLLCRESQLHASHLPLLAKLGFNISSFTPRQFGLVEYFGVQASSVCTLLVPFQAHPFLRLVPEGLIPFVSHPNPGVVAQKCTLKAAATKKEALEMCLNAGAVVLPGIVQNKIVPVLALLKDANVQQPGATSCECQVFVFPQLDAEEVELDTMMHYKLQDKPRLRHTTTRASYLHLCLATTDVGQIKELSSIIQGYFGCFAAVIQGAVSTEDEACANCNAAYRYCECDDTFLHTMNRHATVQCNYGHTACVIGESRCPFEFNGLTCGQTTELLHRCACATPLSCREKRNYVKAHCAYPMELNPQADSHYYNVNVATVGEMEWEVKIGKGQLSVDAGPKRRVWAMKRGLPLHDGDPLNKFVKVVEQSGALMAGRTRRTKRLWSIAFGGDMPSWKWAKRRIMVGHDSSLRQGDLVYESDAWMVGGEDQPDDIRDIDYGKIIKLGEQFASVSDLQVHDDGDGEIVDEYSPPLRKCREFHSQQSHQGPYPENFINFRRKKH